MRESPIEQYFCKLVRAEGGRAYKWVSPGNDGVPDRLVFLHGFIFLVELKSTEGRLSAQQKAQHRELKRLGYDVTVISSKEQAKLWVGFQSAVMQRMKLTAGGVQ